MKNLVSCIIFCIIVIVLFFTLNKIILQKIDNRYYILEQDFNKKEEKFDILVFGSCHSYTSFNPTYLKENYNMSSYVLGNPGEIIPTTYVRMKEQFKKYTPKYAIVEIWGINPYCTYDSTEKILGKYLKNNVERLPLSLAKLELINDFNLDVFEMNCAIPRYKDRILSQDIKDIDFSYSFEQALEHLGYFETEIEMSSRLSNNGFSRTSPNDVSNFFTKETTLESDSYLEIEPIIVKYINKIIDLCKKNNVELIFYRAPYLASEIELQKLNHFKEICSTNNIPFVDLQKDLTYNYLEDFHDEYHLCTIGANKSTDYLANYILNKK